MNPRALDIRLLFDSHVPPSEISDYETLFNSSDDWKDERDVFDTLRGLGHKVTPLPVYESASDVIADLHQNRPDIIFYMCESVAGNRSLSANLLATIELLEIPYTGACSEAMILCRDKGTSKAILHQGGISVPQFEILRRGERVSNFHRFTGPVIVKPLGLEASEGIHLSSIARDKADANERAQVIFQEFETDVIIEEFVPGREIYVGALGNGRVEIFPPQELFFGRLPDQDQRIATYKAKWDKGYRRKWGIDSGPARPIDDKIWQRIEKQCRKMFKLLRLGSGYARFDLRLREDGTFYLLEANPNPAIHHEDDFPGAARHHGVGYPDLLKKIVDLGLRRDLIGA